MCRLNIWDWRIEGSERRRLEASKARSIEGRRAVDRLAAVGGGVLGWVARRACERVSVRQGPKTRTRLVRGERPDRSTLSGSLGPSGEDDCAFCGEGWAWSPPTWKPVPLAAHFACDLCQAAFGMTCASLERLLAICESK